MIVDSFNRVHNYLRISLTDNCNLRCFYCMPNEEYDFTPASQLMQPSEILTLSNIFVNAGVTKIRLTGGEPLVRKDAAEIILSLAKLPIKLTLTTNATRLHQYLNVLKEANVKSLNISLDTLNADKFHFITKRNQFDLVKDNIELFLNHGFHLKINVVVMKGINDNEILDFIEWTKHTAIDVRFIEFMPFSGNHWNSEKVVSLQDILNTINESYDFESLESDKHETAKNFRIIGHAGTFAVISTMTSHFCGECNRMRLTADGKLKNCLFSKNETDLLTPLRNSEDVLPLIHKSISQKALQLGGQFDTDMKLVKAEEIENRSMITIGG